MPIGDKLIYAFNMESYSHRKKLNPIIFNMNGPGEIIILSKVGMEMQVYHDLTPMWNIKKVSA
jgi:hypothetical protein